MFTLTSSPSMDCDDEDGEVSGGFYSQDFESVDQLNLDLDASSHQNAVTIDQFIDTKNLTSNHVLSPPGNFSREESGGESFVQHAQEQFDAGEKVKFTDGIKAKQHFSLAALYFQRAAEGISNSDIITKQSLKFLADNAETMAIMLEKYTPKTTNTTSDTSEYNSLSPLSTKKSPLSSPKYNSVFDEPALPPSSTLATDSNLSSASLSESAYNLENVLNAPHHYDQIYTILPMSSSMSFFGGFNPSPVPSEENSRIGLSHSRQRVSGVSKVPAMDLSMSSSFALSLSTSAGSATGTHLSTPMRLFMQDLRMLERRLGAIGLMPLTESADAASIREKDHLLSKSALSSSTARLNFLSSRLDESFIVLPSDGHGHGIPPSRPPSSPVKTRGQHRQASPPTFQPNPYGNPNSKSNSKTHEKSNSNNNKSNNNNGSNESTTAASATSSLSSSSSSDQTSYWGAGIGLLQMASKMTGIATGEVSGGGNGDGKTNNNNNSSKKNKSSVLSSAPYGGAAAQQQRKQQQLEHEGTVHRGGGGGEREGVSLFEEEGGGRHTLPPDTGMHIDGHDVASSMHWNECSTVFPSNTMQSNTVSSGSGSNSGSGSGAATHNTSRGREEEEEGSSDCTSRGGGQGRVRVDSWEDVQPSTGEKGRGEYGPTAAGRMRAGAGEEGGGGGEDSARGTEGVLRLLSTIERLSEENSKLEKTVEALKSTQHKNSLLTAQIDQFKVEYKLKIDQMKADIAVVASNTTTNTTSSTSTTGSSNNNNSVTTGSKGSLSADVKDKKLNELERTVNALLRKMTEMKQDGDRKDEVIKQYKAKRDKREKEKRSKDKERNNGSGSDRGAGGSSGVGQQQQDKRLPLSSSSSSSSSSPSARTSAPAPIPIPPPSSSSSMSGSTTSSPSSSISSRRGIASKTVSTSSATATAALCVSGSDNNNSGNGSSSGGGGTSGAGMSMSQSGRNNGNSGQSRSRISLTSAAPSTATATLRTSLKREINAGGYSPPKPNSSLRKGHQQQRK